MSEKDPFDTFLENMTAAYKNQIKDTLSTLNVTKHMKRAMLKSYEQRLRIAMERLRVLNYNKDELNKLDQFVSNAVKAYAEAYAELESDFSAVEWDGTTN